MVLDGRLVGLARRREMLTRPLTRLNPFETTPDLDVETSGPSVLSYLTKFSRELARNMSSVGLLRLPWGTKIRFGFGLIRRGDKSPFGSKTPGTVSRLLPWPPPSCVR
jgi:hypothetical protein